MKRFIIIIIVVIFYSLSAFICGQAQSNKDYQMSFSLDRDSNSHLVIKPMCLNNTKKEVVLRYRLEFRRLNKNKPDIKPIVQSGIVQLLPGEEKSACRMEVPAPAKEGYQLDFYLFKKGELVGVYSISRQVQ